MVLIFTECGIKKVLFLDLPELYKPCDSIVTVDGLLPDGAWVSIGTILCDARWLYYHYVGHNDLKLESMIFCMFVNNYDFALTVI